MTLEHPSIFPTSVRRVRYHRLMVSIGKELHMPHRVTVEELSELQMPRVTAEALSTELAVVLTALHDVQLENATIMTRWVELVPRCHRNGRYSYSLAVVRRALRLLVEIRCAFDAGAGRYVFVRWPIPGELSRVASEYVELSKEGGPRKVAPVSKSSLAFLDQPQLDDYDQPTMADVDAYDYCAQHAPDLDGNAVWHRLEASMDASATNREALTRAIDSQRAEGGA